VRRSSRRSTRRTSRAAPRSAKGWSPATTSRILDNEKYTGRWIWNRTESRRDPKTGRRRRFDKPESEWVINENEELRIVPTQLWEAVRERRKTMHRTWPGGNGNRGFSREQGSRQAHFPTHLLAGAMVCGSCEATIACVALIRCRAGGRLLPRLRERRRGRLALLLWSIPAGRARAPSLAAAAGCEAVPELVEV